MSARLPVRWRLTLWYVVFLAFAFLLFGLTLYFAIRIYLYNSFEEQLRNRASLTLAGITEDSNTNPQLDQETIQNLSGEEQFVRLLTLDGSEIVDTSAEVGIPASEMSVLEGAAAGEDRLTKVDGDEEQFWVVTYPVKADNEVIGVLEIGASSEDEDELLQILLLALGVSLPIIIIAGAGGGYFLAGRALQPVARITSLAASIGAEDLNTRLDLDLPDDELGRLARTFDAMLARIEDAFEQQRRFTGDAAHELRTPLAVIRSEVDLALSRTRSTEEYRQALVEVDQDVERLTDLVTSLLTLSRADSGQLPIRLEPFRADAAIESAVDICGGRAAAAGQTIRVESSATTALGDDDLIVQVLVNLLENAIAHTPQGGQILIGNQQDGVQIRFWVEDNGTGISPEHLPRAFDRFYRVDPGRTRRSGGTGLGLSISKAIVEAHGGAITIASKLGEGTRVAFVLSSTQLESDTSLTGSS